MTKFKLNKAKESLDKQMKKLYEGVRTDVKLRQVEFEFLNPERAE